MHASRLTNPTRRVPFWFTPFTLLNPPLSPFVNLGRVLRKAVRRTDSLLFATEGRIGGPGGRASFLGTYKSRRALGRRVVQRSRFQGYVPCGNLLTVGYRFPPGPFFWGVFGSGLERVWVRLPKVDFCGEGVWGDIG